MLSRAEESLHTGDIALIGMMGHCDLLTSKIMKAKCEGNFNTCACIYLKENIRACFPSSEEAFFFLFISI